MKRINCWFFYNLHRRISDLKEFTAYKLKNDRTFFELISSSVALKEFINHPIIKLNNSVKAAHSLYSSVEEALEIAKPFEEKIGNTLLTKKSPASNKEEIGWVGEVIGQKTRDFEIILASELETLETYFVSPIRAYDTKIIIDDFSLTLSLETATWLSDKAKFDWKEAGRCLAFQLFTACGFHLLRAIESILVVYYADLTNGKNLLDILEEKDRSFGRYIEKLREEKAPEKILEVLNQIKKLHRNPLMHPEDTLTENEAITLVGISISCIETICDISTKKRKLKVK